MYKNKDSKMKKLFKTSYSFVFTFNIKLDIFIITIVNYSGIIVFSFLIASTNFSLYDFKLKKIWFSYHFAQDITDRIKVMITFHKFSS